MYTAGQTAGTYQVVATDTTSGQSGQAAVSVDAPAASGISIFPGQSIQNTIAQYPAGTTFVLKAGVHRLQQVQPRNGDTFVGEAGTVLSGAKLLTGFSQVGSVWAISGQTQEASAYGQCLAAYPRCNRPEELFIDDVRQRHVGSVTSVTAGTWFFDYGADTIYVGTNPSGHVVETSVTPYAFSSSAYGVTVSGMTIEKYASAAQKGAVQPSGASNWIVTNNVIRLNHGEAVGVGPAMQILNNSLLRNGQEGIGGGSADGLLVQNNEIAYNNEAGFDPVWEAGGAKVTMTTNLVYRGNFTHHNAGPGLWCDIDCSNTLYEGNVVEDNAYAGIFEEISYGAVIRNNTVQRNGLGDPRGWLWGNGILVAASPNVEVYGNTLVDNANGIVGIQQNRGTGSQGPHEINNLNVHDNTVTMHQGETGLAQDIGDDSYFTSRNNWFSHNTYYLGTNTRYFQWMDGSRTEQEWVSYGQDVTGTFIR